MTEVKLYHKESLSIDLIEETFCASFPVDFDKEYWKWRFLENPNSDKTYISYIIEDGLLAAYYAISPMVLNYNGENKNIALSNMTMTHPKYRGRGYFKLLAKTLYNNLKEDGFLGVFGFANHNSHYGFKKYLDWQDLSQLNIFSLNKNKFRPLRESSAIEFKSEVLTNEIVFRTASLNINPNKFGITRNNDNLNWRLVDNPTNTYYCLSGNLDTNLELMIIYKDYQGEIDIMEVFYSKPDNFNALIESFTYLFGLGSSKINLWSNIHSLEHLTLEKHGMEETNFNTYFGLIPFTEDKELLEYKNWHYRFLDSDIF